MITKPKGNLYINLSGEAYGDEFYHKEGLPLAIIEAMPIQGDLGSRLQIIGPAEFKNYSQKHAVSQNDGWLEIPENLGPARVLDRYEHSQILESLGTPKELKAMHLNQIMSGLGLTVETGGRTL